MAGFMRLKYKNPKLKQSDKANQLGMSSCTVQRYRNDINMLSPYRTNSNNTKKRTIKVKNTDFDNNTHPEADDKITSNDFKRPQPTSNESSKKTKTKNNLKGGFIHENIEIKEHYLDKVLKNNDS